MLILLAFAMWYAGGPSTDAGKYLLPSVKIAAAELKEKEVDRIEVERNRPTQEKFVIVRDGDGQRWRIVEPYQVRADQIAANDLVHQVFEAKRAENVEAPPTAGAAGLDPPSAVVTLKKGAERAVSIRLGDTSLGKQKAVVYCSSSDRPKDVVPVFAVDLDRATKNLSELRDRTLLASAPSDYTFIRLEEKGKEPKGPLFLEKVEDRWRYRIPGSYEGPAEMGDAGAPGVADKPPSGVSGLLSELSNLRVEVKDDKDNDFVEDGVAAKDLGKYGLDVDKGEVLQIQIERVEKGGVGDDKKEQTKPLELLVAVGKKPDEKNGKYLAASPTDEKGKDDKPLYSIVKVAAKDIDAIRKSFADPNALRSRNLAPLGSQGPVAVRVKIGSDVLEFLREASSGGKWTMVRNGEEQATDSAAVEALVNQLVQPGQIKSFVDKPEVEKLGLKDPKVVVALWTEGVEKVEPKDDKKDDKKDEKKEEKQEDKKPRLALKKDVEDKPAVRLGFGYVEDHFSAVRRETRVPKADKYDEVVVRAPELIYDKAKQPALAYLDKTLTPFAVGFDAAEGVTKLTLERGGATYELLRPDAKGDGWTFAAPTELKDRKADPRAIRSVLTALNMLRATRLVTEKPTDAELKEYGLTPPSIKVVVTKEEKKDDKTTTSTFTYEFGKDADMDSQYARQSQRTMVFVVDKKSIGALTDELLDKTILSIEDAKVKAVKLTGWKNLFGAPYTVDLEYKEGGPWVAKAPPGFVLDPGKVHDFIDGVAHLKADKFVSANTKIKEAFDKDEDKTALTVELYVEGDDKDKPVTLKVVNLTSEKAGLGADKGYYARTPKLPNELFKVPDSAFQKAMEKPACFSSP
jgi:hypothetical protein